MNFYTKKRSITRIFSFLMLIVMLTTFAVPVSAVSSFNDLSTVIDLSDSNPAFPTGGNGSEPNVPPDTGGGNSQAGGDCDTLPAEESEPNKQTEKENADLLPPSLGASGFPQSGSFAYFINGPMARGDSGGVISYVADNFITHKYPFKGGTSVMPAFIFSTSDGRAAYCVEPTRFNSSNGKPVTGSTQYDKLSQSKQNEIARAIAANTAGTSDRAAYVATQTIIWEIAAGEKHKSGSIYLAVIAANSSVLSSKYDSILSKMQSISEVPSFMNTDKSNPTLHQMQESSGSWSIDLTNTNSNATMTQADFKSKAPFQYTVSGNKLKVSSSSEPGADSFVEWNSNGGSSGLVFWLSNEQIKASPAGSVPSTGYMTFSVEGTGTGEVEEEEEPKIGYLTIYKYNGVNNQPLGGAVFRVKSDNFIDEAFVVPYGGATIVIPLGDQDSAEVTVTEVSPPYGFVGDSTPKTVTVTANNIVNVAQVGFVNYPEACSLTIYKYEKGDYGHPLEGAKFRIRYADPNVSAQTWTLTTDSSGRIHIDLPAAGTLIIEELEAPQGGYVIGEISTWDVTVIRGENKQIDISNDKKAELVVVKKDAVTGQHLKGAVFKATLLESHTPPYESGISYTAESGADGRAVFTGLHPGQWRVEELTPPPYFLPTTKVETVTILDGNQATVTLTFENEPYSGLTIRKVDSINGAGLKGAIFSLYRGTEVYPTDFLGDFQSDDNGRIVIQNLESNQYYTVVERQAPDNYLVDPEHSVQTVFIKPDALDNNLTIIFRNPPKPKLLITKIDEVTGERLAGAVFRVAERGSKEFVDVETGPDGTVLLENLNVNWFQISEIRSPSGYVLESGVVHDIELIAGETAKLVVKNRKVPLIKIQKIDSVTNQPMPGVVFEISEKNGRNLGEFVTDINGEIQLETGPALLVIREKRTLDGYLMDETEKELLVEAGKSYVIPWRNTPKNPIIIKKLDSVTGKPVPDTVFTVTKVGGEFVGTYTTGHNGYATVPGQEPGWFLIKEERANPAYIASGETKLVQLRAGEAVAVEFHNKPRTGLQIRKYDSVTGQPIPGVQFTIEEQSGKRLGTFTSDAQGFINLADQEEKWVVVAEVQASEGYKPDFVPRTIFLESGKLNILEFPNQPYPHLIVQKTDEKGQPMEGVKFRFMDQYSREIGVFSTNHAGQIHLTGMNEGRYYLQEISTKPGYEVDSSIRELSLQWGKTETVQVVNKPLASLRIVKIDVISKQPIPGTTFLIYDSKNNILGEYVSDDRGLVELPSSLVPQKLRIKEIKAAPGYVLDEQLRTVEVKSGETTEIVWTNQPERGQIRIVKKASDDNALTKQKKGALLEGAVFEIVDKDKNVVDTITTGKDGMATSKPLPLGKYAIQEKASPHYFLLNEQVFYAEIKLHNDMVEFEVENEPADISVTVEKRGNVETLCGDTIRYDFSNIANTSNVELEEFYWHDQLPVDAVRIQKLFTGTWNERLTYRVEYKTNLKTTYRTLRDGLHTNVNNELDLSPAALKLAGNEYVTDFRLVFGTVKAGFREVEAPFIFVKVLDDLPHEYRFTNKTDVGGRREKEWAYDKDAWTTIVYRANLKKENLPKTGI